MSDNVHTPELLKEYQSYPLDVKILMTERRIHEYYTGYGSIGYGNAYVSFSGGKDSTVLLAIARKLYPDIRACFCNTGLEYPEIQSFVKRHENIDIVRPTLRFDEVISQYGYPLISKEVSQAIYYARMIGQKKSSKWGRNELLGIREGRFSKEQFMPIASDAPFKISHYCCNVNKKAPLDKYARKNGLHPIVATMAEESARRTTSWLRTGCNSFECKIQSKPMSFWLEQDVLRYIIENDLEICSVYGDIVAVDDYGNEYDPQSTLISDCKLKCTGCLRTGCVYCAFGFHNERGETRFQRLAKTHPRQYEYCMGGGQWVDNPAYDATASEYDGEWKNWNPKKIWVPSKQGIWLKAVFDMVNEIYGKDFYRYD